MNGESSDEASALWLRNANSRPSVEGIAQSITEDAAYYDGHLPEANALAWYAWLSGMVECGKFSLADFETLCKLLPPLEGEQSLKKFLDPKEPDEQRLKLLASFDATFEDLKTKLEQDARSFGGILPELNNIAWSAYIGGLVEFGLVLLKHHAYFCDHFLPNRYCDEPENDPTYGVLVGVRSPKGSSKS